MNISYKDIELSRTQRKLLKKLKHHTLKESSFSENDLRFLKKYKLIKCLNTNEAFHTGSEPIYIISDTGLMYTRFIPKDTLRTWYPHIVATIALIVSIVAIILSIASLSQ